MKKILPMLQHTVKGFCTWRNKALREWRPISGVEIQCNFAGNGFHCQDVTHCECALSAHGIFCLLSWLESSSPQTAPGSKRQTMDDCAWCGLSRYLHRLSYLDCKCFNCQLWTAVLSFDAMFVLNLEIFYPFGCCVKHAGPAWLLRSTSVHFSPIELLIPPFADFVR